MNMILTILAGITIATGAIAGSKPLQIAITPEMALFDRTERIEGLSLSIWGENPQSALALGVVNGSTGRSSGLSGALILNYADDYKGIQWAPINYARGDVLGWQAGFVNYTGGRMKGLQTGAVNCATRLTGLQIGLLNYAETAETGVQVGLLNLLPQNEWLTGLPNELAPGMVFVNWRF